MIRILAIETFAFAQPYMYTTRCAVLRVAVATLRTSISRVVRSPRIWESLLCVEHQRQNRDPHHTLCLSILY